MPPCGQVAGKMLLFTALFCVAANAQNKKASAPHPEYQSYLAHIAAANASLRLNEAAEAQRWLAAAPAKHRNWEWRYLNARSDKSTAALKFAGAAPAATRLVRFIKAICDSVTMAARRGASLLNPVFASSFTKFLHNQKIDHAQSRHPVI